MGKKQPVIITRTDLISQLSFSERYNISRGKLTQLIKQGKLSGELISNIFYISLLDGESVKSALSYKSRHQGDWARGGTSVYKPPKRKYANDNQFDTAWEAWQKEHPNG